MSTLTAEATRPVLTALRKLGGRATVGDVAAASGLSHDRAEQTLRDLLENRRGHLEVGEEGALVYNFDPRFIRRDAEPLWQRFKRGAWSVFQKAFKVWIVAMLVVYFIIFVALLLAAMFAGDRDGEGGGLGGGSGRHRGGGLPLGDMLFWYWIWSPGWRHRPYYGEGYGTLSRRDRKSGPPFYKKVFAFVFGPDEPKKTQEQKDRELLRMVRSRKGVMTAPELVQLTGMGLQEAEEELGRLMAAHEGDVRVAGDGTILYEFPSLMVSAHGEVKQRAPLPAWQRLEPKQPLTGNKTSTNVLVAGINSFNLVAAASAPLFIFPRLGIGGTAAEIGLIWVPVVFSTVFFSVPLVRSLGVARENAKRLGRNVRKVLMGLVSDVSLRSDAAEALASDEAAGKIKQLLGEAAPDDGTVTEALDRLVAEFDGEVEVGADGVTRIRFDEFRGAVQTAHRERLIRALQEQRVGDIIYSSADDQLAQGERDLEAFDRALSEGEPEVPELAGAGAGPGSERPSDESSAPKALPPADDLTDYLNDPLRVAFRDERELAAQMAEMSERREALRDRRRF